ncbi:MAG: serine/threonine protein kinase, bacterial [Actinomycetota bacterium]
MAWKLGSYRVDDKPFAAGATAEVFAARKGRTGERVALKVLPLRTFRDRAEAEADIGRIDHPRLLTVHASVVDERRGVVGLVMDLANGGDLRNALRGADAPTPIEMLQIADDVLAAVEALHAVGLVHRDIKPENIMLERVDGQLRARLGDMGIARPIDRTRSTGSVLGTDLYIAPEVHDGGAPSAAADLWAVGYVLYEGLFGAPPHADAKTAYQAIGLLRAEGPNRPPNVPDSIWNVVAALLAPTPDQRPESARAARHLLESAGPAAEEASAAAGERDPVAAVRRPGARRRSTERGHDGFVRPVPTYERRPAVARAFAGIAAVVLVVGGLAWIGGRNRLALFGAEPRTIGAVRSLTPLPPESDAVVPTQYQWRLKNGMLTGRLDVSNPSDQPTAATDIPELFPPSAVRGNALALVGHDGPVEKQRDGSVLVRFEVPSIAPHEHHVVAFRMSVPPSTSDRSLLAKLVRDREDAITRHALALSDAPTLASISIDLVPSTVTVGQRANANVHGRTPKQDEAPAELLKDAHLEVIGSAGIARVDGLSVVGLAPGAVVVRVVVGNLQADTPINVVAPPVTVPKTTVTHLRRAPTTQTTIIEEEAPPPAPKDVEV